MKTLITTVALLIAALPAAAQQQVDERFSTSSDGEVLVVNTSGSVQVEGWNRNEIHVTGTLGRGTERLDISPGGNRTEIRVIIPRNARDVRGSDLVVRVPSRKDIWVETVSADIEIEEITGNVEARSVSGDVTASGNPQGFFLHSTSGDIVADGTTSSVMEAQTVSGEIQLSGRAESGVRAESVSGDVLVDVATPETAAKSVSGRIELRDVGEQVTVNTVSGEARVTGDRIRTGMMETVSGTIRFDGSLERDAKLSLTSHSGEITLALPASVDADFEVNTFSGDISNDWGAEARRTDRYAPGKELHFTVGDGDARVTVNTFSGEVKLLRR